jgi:hypothetical protein
MNSYLKFFLYFLVGFILYYLLRNKIVEGFSEVDLDLLFGIMKERTDIGCRSHAGQCLEYGSEWSLKTDVKDENYYLCNNSSKNSIVSTLNTGNRCNRDLCCENTTCSHKFFNKGYTCRDRQILPFAKCPFGKLGQECLGHCCGQQLSGKIKILFNSIVEFKKTIQDSDDSEHTIFLKDLLYFIYNSLLNLQTMLPITSSDSTITIPEMFTNGSPNANHTYENYEKLNQYFESAYSGILRGKYVESAEFQTIMDSIIFKDIISDALTGPESDTDTVDYINNFLTKIANIQLGGGRITSEQISNKYGNFLTYYLDYGEEGQENTLENLELDLKKTLVLITKPSPNLKDGGITGTPISLFSFGSNNWHNKRITLSQFQLFL